MNLRLNELKSVVRQTKDELAFCNEMKRIFGPALTGRGMSALSRNASYLAEVARLERTQIPEPKIHILMKCIKHEDPEVRRLIARLLPERFTRELVDDADDGVQLVLERKLLDEDKEKKV